MTSRRDLVIGGLCAAGMGLAAAAVPRRIMASQRNVVLDKVIPARIGPWQQQDAAGNILPRNEDSLSAQLYSQLVSRVYTAPDRDTVMMVIAYGTSQSDTLQLHRPEVCYEAAGFRITRSMPVAFNARLRQAVTGRYLLAESAYRKEAILYWTRIGDALPTDRFQQQMAKLAAGLHGVVPDGTLTRISILVDSDQDMPDTLAQFATLMLGEVSAATRRTLVGGVIG